MKRILKKTIQIISISLFVTNSFASPIIGYGSSDSVLSAKNQELFIMGFEVGLQKVIKSKPLSELLVLDQVSNGSQLGAIGSAERLLAKGVSLLVGFPTSHEALLAAKVAKQKGVLAIFSGASHSDLAKMGSSVFTTGESMDFAVESTLQFMRKKFNGKRGLLISNPYAVFSTNQEDVFREILAKKENQDIPIKLTHLSKDLLLNEIDLMSVRNGEFDYIVVTPYADESAKLLEQLEKNRIDLPLITNSSWTTGDLDFGRRFLTTRKSPAYCATLWLKGSPDSREFERLIQGRYGRPATAEIAYGYDLGVIAGRVLESIKGPITKESVMKEFVKHKCFEGLSSGKMCFTNSGGHAIRNFTFLRFSKNGFVVEK